MEEDIPQAVNSYLDSLFLQRPKLLHCAHKSMPFDHLIPQFNPSLTFKTHLPKSKYKSDILIYVFWFHCFCLQMCVSVHICAGMSSHMSVKGFNSLNFGN
jgi:hypothetical protein